MNKRNTNKEKPEQIAEQPTVTDEQVDTRQVQEQNAVDQQASEQTAVKTNKKKVDIDNPAVDKILKLYPQYDKVYISKLGFVYPGNAPEYQRKDAVLYENPYFNK